MRRAWPARGAAVRARRRRHRAGAGRVRGARDSNSKAEPSPSIPVASPASVPTGTPVRARTSTDGAAAWGPGASSEGTEGAFGGGIGPGTVEGGAVEGGADVGGTLVAGPGTVVGGGSVVVGGGTVVVTPGTLVGGGTAVVGGTVRGGALVVGGVVDGGTVVFTPGTVVGVGTVVGGVGTVVVTPGAVVGGEGTVVVTPGTLVGGGTAVVGGDVVGGVVVGGGATVVGGPTVVVGGETVVGGATVVVGGATVVVGGETVVVGGDVTGGAVVGGAVVAGVVVGVGTVVVGPVVVGGVVVGGATGTVVVGAGGRARLVKRACVVPGPTTTVTRPAAGLAVPRRRSAGRTAMAETSVPGGTASVMVMEDPTGSVPATEHRPSGAGPAGTLTAVPPTSNVNRRPSVMPEPATLHTFRTPVSNRLPKVTIVSSDTSPATTRTVAWRAGRSSRTRRSSGQTATPVTVIPGFGRSTTVRSPAGTGRAAEQAPTGTSTVRPASSKVNVPVTPSPSAALHTSTYPVLAWAPASTVGPMPSSTPNDSRQQSSASRTRASRRRGALEHGRPRPTH